MTLPVATWVLTLLLIRVSFSKWKLKCTSKRNDSCQSHADSRRVRWISVNIIFSLERHFSAIKNENSAKTSALILNSDKVILCSYNHVAQDGW